MKILRLATFLIGAFLSFSAAFAADTVICNAGEYLPKYASVCEICTVNNWCPGGEFPIDYGSEQGINYCGDNMTSPKGSDSSDDCSVFITCNAGQYLPANLDYCKTCVETFWCPGGGFLPESFDQGANYCGDAMISVAGSDEAADCSLSPDAIICSAGEYLPINSSSCEICLNGSWCPGGTFLMSTSDAQGLNKCGGDMVSDQGSDEEIDCTITCNEGDYLPANASSCLICPENYWCTGGIFSKYYKDQGIETCGEAMISPAGSKTINECTVSPNATICNAGEYLSGTTDKCEICPIDNWCPGGNFLPDHTDHGLNKCNEGTTSVEGSDSSDDCISSAITCLAGEYLPETSTKCDLCLENNWCPGGDYFQSTKDQGINYCGDNMTAPKGSDSSDDCSSIKMVTCGAGNFFSSKILACDICPANSWCPGGDYQEIATDQGLNYCGDNMFSNEGSDSFDDCTSVSSSVTCNAGEWLPANHTSCSTCPINNWCPGGTYPVSGTDQGFNVCPDSSVSNFGSDELIDCTQTCIEGEYLSADSLMCKQCPAGYWCPGITGSIDPSDQGINYCGDNMTSPLGSKTTNDCSFVSVTCGAGYFLPGTTTTCSVCNLNYWCPGGTYTYSETEDQGKTACPAEIPYSPYGSPDETYCSITASESVVCQAGQFLPTNSFACFECPVNSWCPGGIFPPSSDYEQGINSCDAGLVSDSGSSSTDDCHEPAITCAEGYYLPANSAICDICTEGNWCPGGDYYQSTENQGLNACPNDGLSPTKASTINKCYKDKLELAVDFGTGTQTCWWESVGYTGECYDFAVTTCQGGYYWNGYDIRCDEVGENYYSPVDSTSRYACPSLSSSSTHGKTETTTASDPSDCYVSVFYTQGDNPISGVGQMYCTYNGDNYGLAEGFISSPLTFTTQPLPGDTQCTDLGIRYCFGGYYMDGVDLFSCVPVIDGYYSYRPSYTEFMSKSCGTDPTVCSTEYGYDPSSLDGMTGMSMCPKSFPNSDGGRDESSDCYHPCDAITVEHSTEVTILTPNIHTDDTTNCEYNVICETGYTAVDNGTISPTCAMSETVTCDAGTYLPMNAAVCSICPIYSYCPGGTFTPSADTSQGLEMCPNMGYSDEGTDSISGCYKSCTEFKTPDYSESVTVAEDKIYWDGMNYGECDYTVTCVYGYQLVPNPRPRIGELSVMCESITGCSDPNALECNEADESTVCRDEYHLESTLCVPNEQSCVIANGTGVQEWVYDSVTGGKWTKCTAVSCDLGYTSDRALTDDTENPCGVCRNKFNQNGDVVVSSWADKNCIIATCMYQGELHRLGGNECIQICDTDGREDDTGTMYWNDTSKKCERVCKPGFKSW